MTSETKTAHKRLFYDSTRGAIDLLKTQINYGALILPPCFVNRPYEIMGHHVMNDNCME